MRGMGSKADNIYTVGAGSLQRKLIWFKQRRDKTCYITNLDLKHVRNKLTLNM